MTVTVVYPSPNVDNIVEFEIQVPSEGYSFIPKVLDYVWHETQGDIKGTQINRKRAEREPLRSAMVGDVFIVSGRYFIVDMAGFVEVDQGTYLRYLVIPELDRLLGWDYARTKNNIGLHIQRL